MKVNRLILTLACAAFLLGIWGGGVLADDEQPSQTEQTAYEYAPGAVPAQDQLADTILPPVHALVVTMVENNLTYNAEDPLFQWTSLYYMLSLYGQMDERAQLSDEFLTVPAETVLDYAAPLFPSLSQLAPVPAELSDRVTYDAKADAYRLARGDEGLIQVQLTSNYPVGPTGREATGQLIYLATGDVLTSFQVELEQVDTMFGCTVTSLILL